MTQIKKGNKENQARKQNRAETNRKVHDDNACDKTTARTTKTIKLIFYNSEKDDMTITIRNTNNQDKTPRTDNVGNDKRLRNMNNQ